MFLPVKQAARACLVEVAKNMNQEWALRYFAGRHSVFSSRECDETQKLFPQVFQPVDLH